MPSGTGTSLTSTTAPSYSTAAAASSSKSTASVGAGRPSPRSSSRTRARRSSTAPGTSSGVTRRTLAAWLSAWSWWRAEVTASGPVMASIRRTLAALDVSVVILNRPISAVKRT